MISIAFAALGYSFMAPILGTIAGNAVMVALLVARGDTYESFFRRLAGYRDVIDFGAYSTAP